MWSTGLVPAAMLATGSSAFAQAVNMGGAGNMIVPDGRTSTHVTVSGRTTSISTSTFSGGNAYNSFSQFQEGAGNTVNLQVPSNANYLVNLVRNGAVNIQGTLNSYKNGQIGGNVVFSDSYGFVVGSRGVINTGSLTVVTPASGVNDSVLGANGVVNNALATQLIHGNVPLSSDGSVIIDGRIVAQHGVLITAHDVEVAGSYSEAVREARHRAMFDSTVNAAGLREGGAIISRNGQIEIVAAGNISIGGTISAGARTTHHAHRYARSGGSVTLSAGGDLDIKSSAYIAAIGSGGSATAGPAVALSATGAANIAGTIVAGAASGGSAGKISLTSGTDTTIASTAVFSATGLGSTAGGAIKVYADSDLSVADGATFNVAATGTGNGGTVELSAANTAIIGQIALNASTVSGEAGTLIEDPYDLVITAGTTQTYGSTDTNDESDGASIVLSATHSITIASDGVVDSTGSTSDGNITIVSPTITVDGGGIINAGSGANAGTILLESFDPTLTTIDPALNVASQTANITIGTGTGGAATITGSNIQILATAELPSTVAASLTSPATTSATITFDNAKVTARGTLTASATATGDVTSTGSLSNAFVATASQTVVANVTVEGASNLQSVGALTLESTVNAASSATSAPVNPYSGSSTLPADAAGAISNLTSSATTIVGSGAGDSSSVTSTSGGVTIEASNTTTSTAKADATDAALLGLSFAVNIVNATTTASVGGAATVSASGLGGTLDVTANSSTTVSTTSLASAQGAPSSFSNSSAAQPYIEQGASGAEDFFPYLSNIEGAANLVQGSGVMALANVTSATSANMSSSATASASGLATVSASALNTSVTTADGSNVDPTAASASTGIGGAVAINIANVTNEATLDQNVTSDGLSVLANMTGTAAQNAFTAEAVSGAGGSEVGISGALATNILNSTAAASISADAVVTMSSADAPLTIDSDDVSTATAIAEPDGNVGTAGAADGKLGVGTSVALNLISTSSAVAIDDGATIVQGNGATSFDPGAVTLDAEATHVVVTEATAGSAGAIAVTPVVALSLVDDQTDATIGALIGGLTASGNVSTTASQTATELTVASGLLGGDSASLGAAIAVAVIDDEALATTSTSIDSTGGNVSFTADNASLSAVSSTASPAGASSSTSGGSADTGSSVTADLGSLFQDAASKAKSGGGTTTDAQTTDEGDAGSEAQTGGGKLAVAAAVAVDASDSSAEAYVAKQVGISAAGSLSIATVNNTDALTTANASAVGSGTNPSAVGIGAAVAVSLVDKTNEAILGASNALSSAPTDDTNEIAAGSYQSDGVSVSALNTDLGATTPTVPTPTAPGDGSGSSTDNPALPVNEDTTGSASSGRYDDYGASATSGAGASTVGVAGSLAVDLVDSNSTAEITGDASVTLNGGALQLSSDNESSSVVTALPAGDGVSGGKVGVGASIALNLVATQSDSDLDNGVTITSAGAVSLDATGAHATVTQADQGASGGVAVVPVAAISLVYDDTAATIGALTDGLDASGDVDVSATQVATEATETSGAAAGSSAAVGAAVGINLTEDHVVATTSTGIESDGSVSFAASGASLGIVSATASATGAAGSDSSDNSSSGSGSSGSSSGVGGTIESLSTDAIGMLPSSIGGPADAVSGAAADPLSSLSSSLSSDNAADDAGNQAQTTQSSVSVAAAVGVDFDDATVQAYVPAAVGIKSSGGLSITTVANTDGNSIADGSAVSTGSGTSVGAAVAITIVNSTNQAILGAPSALASTPTNIAGVTTAGDYDIGSLTLEALQTNLGGVTPVVPGQPAAAAITNPPADWTDNFSAAASSGAGGGDIGVAGALGVDVIAADSIAEVTGASDVDITPVANATTPAAGDASLTIESDNETSSTVSALPTSGGGAGGGKVGVGASVALNLVGTQSLSLLDDGATIDGAGVVLLQATGTHAASTQADQGTAPGSSGEVAVIPSAAISLVDDETQATIGALIGGLDTTGSVTVSALQIATEATEASGLAAGSKAAIGAALAINLTEDSVLATTSTGIDSGGSVSFSASGASLGIVSATASAMGASGSDSSDDSSSGGGSSGSSSDDVGSTISSTATSALGLLPSNIGSTVSSVDSAVSGPLGSLSSKLSSDNAASDAGSKAQTTESSVSVAAAIGVDFDDASVEAYVPAAVGVKASGGLSIVSTANTDGNSIADGTAVATSASSSSGSSGSSSGSSSSSGGGVGVGAAVAITLVESTNEAQLGTPSAYSSSTPTNTASTAADIYNADSLTLEALQTNLGGVTPVVPGQPAAAPIANPPADWTDNFGASATSGAGGANIGVAGALGVDAIETSSLATVADGMTITLTGGATLIKADNEGQSDVTAAPAGAASGTKLGVGASVALNGVVETTTATLGSATLDGAAQIDIDATSAMATDSQAKGGASGGTAIDAVVTATILDEETTASIGAGADLIVTAGTGGDGSVTLDATSSGANTASADGDTSNSGQSTAAVGGSVAIITGVGILTPLADLLFGTSPFEGITSSTTASIDRNLTTTAPTTSTGDALNVEASTSHSYLAQATATAGGANFNQLEDGGNGLVNTAGNGLDSAATYKNQVLSLDALNLDSVQSAISDTSSGISTAQSDISSAQSSISTIKSGISGFSGNSSKLSATASIGVAVVGDNVSAEILNSSGGTRTINASGGVTVTASDDGDAAALGNSASVQKSTTGIGIGAAVVVLLNNTTASIANETAIVTASAVDVAATTTENTDPGFTGAFAAEAMSGATGQDLSVAGSLAVAFTNSTTDASLGNSVTIDDGMNSVAGAISVVADNTSELAAKAWGGSLSTSGNGVGASIATIVSDDTYEATIGTSASIDAASLDVSATNEKVDNPLSYLTTLESDATTDYNSTAETLGQAGTGSGSVGSGLETDADTALSQIGSLGDAAILGTSNYYTEVIAGAASDDGVAVAGALALQVIVNKVNAEVGANAKITTSGAVKIASADNTVGKALVGSVGVSTGTTGVGIDAGVIVDTSSVTSSLDGNASTGYADVEHSGSLAVTATASQAIDLFEVSAAGADETGVAGIFGFVFQDAGAKATIAAGSQVTSAGLVNVAASNGLSLLNLAGGFAGAGETAVGATIIATVDDNSADAEIQSDDDVAGDETQVTAGSVTVSAGGSGPQQQFINVAAAGAAAGEDAISGAVTPIVETVNTTAEIGQFASVTANAGDIDVTSQDATQFLNIGGAFGGAGEVGVGASAAVDVVVNQTIAAIGDGSTINATGALVVEALASENAIDAVISGAAAGETAVGGALASSIITDTTQAYIGEGVTVGNTDQPTFVDVAASDTTTLTDIAGGIAIAGEAGVGASADVNVLVKNTDAWIGQDSSSAPTRATKVYAGNVEVSATSEQDVYALIAGFAVGGEAGLAGTASVYTLVGSTLAGVGDGDTVIGAGNVAVLATNANSLDRIIGSLGVGGEAGIGASLGLAVSDQTTTATIGADATVVALGEMSPLTVTTGFQASFANYASGALTAELPLSGLAAEFGTQSNEDDPTTAGEALDEGASLFVLDRILTPETESVHGVVVDATSTDSARSASLGAGLGGEAGIALSGSVPIVINDTEASIGANARINQGSADTGANADQSVTVASADDLYSLNAAGAFGAAGEVGVGAGADVAVTTNTTKAWIGEGAQVAATDNVSVTANGSEDYAAAAGAAAIGGEAGLAGGVNGYGIQATTEAYIDNDASVFADGNVAVTADNETRSIILAGAAGLGVATAGFGAGVDVSVIVKTTEAYVGTDASITALGNTASDLTDYVGDNLTDTADEQGLLVQANSGESVVTITAAGAAGLFAGIAGVGSVETLVDTTEAFIDTGAQINQSVSEQNANADQSVNVTARDSSVLATIDASAGGAFNVDPENPISVGVAGALDIEVVANTTTADIESGASVTAADAVQVNALSNKVVDASADSIGIGAVAVSGALELVVIADGLTPTQSGDASSSGALSYFDGQTGTGTSTELNALGSSSDSNVQNAATMAQTDETAAGTPTIDSLVTSTSLTSGTSATIQDATIKAGGNVGVSSLDDDDTLLFNFSLAVGIGGAGVVSVTAVDADNTAAIEHDSNITAGSVAVSALSDHSFEAIADVTTAAGDAGAAVAVGDGTNTTATIGDTSLSGDSSVVTTVGTTSVTADNSTSVSTTTLAVAGGSAPGLAVVVIDPTTEASIASDAQVTAGQLANAANNPAANIVVQADGSESYDGTGGGVAVGSGAGALTVYVLEGSTDAEIYDATLSATGSVGVLANGTSSAQVIDGTVGADGSGASLGVSVIGLTTTSSIDSDANVTAYGLGNTDPGISYVSGYDATFGSYSSGAIQPSGEGALQTGTNSDDPITTGEITSVGDDLLAEDRSSAPIESIASGVVVSAASANEIDTYAIGAAAGGVALSASVPIVTVKTTATIGQDAKINQGSYGSAGAGQSIIVDAANDFYNLGIAGSAAAGAGAGVSAAVYNGTTEATIGQDTDVQAKDDVDVVATGLEDFAGVDAAFAAGGPLAGALSILDVNDSTKAQIDGGAIVDAGNNVAVLSDDETRTATIAGSLAVASALGAGLGVSVVTKDTEATIVGNADVTADADGADTFNEYTGADFTSTTTGHGVLVQTDSGESLFVISVAGAVAGDVSGAISLQIVKDTTLATIDDGAQINTLAALNGVGAGADQDVNISALDSTGIVAASGAGTLLGVMAGAIVVSVIEDTTGASIGDDATVDAKRSVYVNALANRPVSATVISGALGEISLAGSIAVLYVGDGIDPNGKAGGELDLGSSSSPLGAADGEESSFSSSLTGNGGLIESTSDDPNAANAASSIGNTFGTPAVSSEFETQNAAVAGTSATIGAATVNAGGGVSVDANDDIDETTLAGGVSVSLVGASAGVSVVVVDTNTLASIAPSATNPSPTAIADVTAGSVAVNAANERTYDDTSFAGTAALGAGLEAAVVVVSDSSDVAAQSADANFTTPGSVQITAQLDREASDDAYGGGIAGAVSAGAVVSDVTFGGSVDATMTDTTVAGPGTTQTPAGSIEVVAMSTDVVAAYTLAAQGGIGAALEGSAATVDVTPDVAASISGGSIYVSGAVELEAQAEDGLSAEALGITVAGGLSAGASIANDTLGADVSATLDIPMASGGNLLAGSLDVEALLNPTADTADNVASAIDILPPKAGAAVSASAGGASGAVLLGVNAASATATNNSTADALIEGGYIQLAPTSNASGALTVLAQNTTNQYAKADGFAAGILSVGAAVANANADTTTLAQIGLDPTHNAGQSSISYSNAIIIAGGAVEIEALGTDTDVADSVAGSGGVVSGTGAGAYTSDTSTVTTDVADATSATTYSEITAPTLAVTATHTDDYLASADTENASVVGGSEAESGSTANNTSNVTIGSYALLIGDANGVSSSNTAPTLDIESADNFNEISGTSANASAGGGLEGVGAESSNNLTGASTVDVDANAGLISGLMSGNPGGLAVVAYSTLQAADLVTLDSKALMDGTGTDSDFRANLTNNVTIGQSAVLLSFGTLDVGTYSTAIGSASSYDSTAGAAGVGSATAFSNVATTQSVDIDSNAALEAFGELNVTPGQYATAGFASDVQSSADAESFVTGIIAIPAADGNADVTNNVTLSVASGAIIEGLQNVVLGAYEFSPTANATGKGTGYELGFIPAYDGSSGTQITAASSLSLDGTVVAGLVHELDITINDATSVNGLTATVDLGGGVPLVYPTSGFVAETSSGLENIALGGGAAIVSFNYYPSYDADTAAQTYFPDIYSVLSNGLSATPVQAFEIGQIFLSAGSVILSADQITGDGTVTAQGAPTLKITNNTDAYLILDGINIPATLGGVVDFTGAADSAPFATNQDGAGGLPSIVIENAYDGALGGANGPAIFVVGAINNVGGSVSIVNDEGSYAANSPVSGEQVSIFAPLGIVAYDAPQGTIATGASVPSQWESEVLFPGGNPSTTVLSNVADPTTGQTDADLAIYYLANIIYNDIPSSDYNSGITYQISVDGAYVDQQQGNINNTFYGVAGNDEFANGASSQNYSTAINDHSEIFLGNCALYMSACSSNPSNTQYGALNNGNAGVSVPNLPVLSTTVSIPVSMTGAETTSGDTTGISAGQLAIKAAIIDIDGPVNVGVPTNYNVTFGGDLVATASQETVTIGYQLVLNGFQFSIVPITEQIYTGGAISEANLIYKNAPTTANQITDITNSVLNENPALLNELPPQTAGSTPLFDVKYDAENQDIILENLTASSGGGFAEFDGAIINTDDAANAKINVQSGYGNVTINNQTGVTLVLNDINTGSASAATALTSTIVIEDTLQPTATNTTTYIYTPSGGVTAYQTSNGALPGPGATPIALPTGSTSSSTYYQPLEGERYDYTYFAELQRSVSVTDDACNANSSCSGEVYEDVTASEWQFQLINNLNSAANPWLYYSTTAVPGSTQVSSNGYVTATPTGTLTNDAGLENTLLQETMSGGVTGYTEASMTYAHVDNLAHNTVEDPGTASDGKPYDQTWTDYFPTNAYLMLNVSVKADFEIPITFESNATANVTVNSNAPVVLSGSIINPNGPTSITSTTGSITQTMGASILTNGLTLSAGANIGTQAQPIVATLTGRIVNATSGTANPAAAASWYSGSTPVGTPLTAGNADVNLQIINSPATLGTITAGNATGGFGNVDISATGNLETTGSYVVGYDISLTSTEGSIGTLATGLGGSSQTTNDFLIAPQVGVDAIGDYVGGIVTANAYSDVALDSAASVLTPTYNGTTYGLASAVGNLQVGLISSTTGSVAINSDGTVYDASGQSSASTLSATQVAAATLNLYDPTELNAATVASFENLVNADATAYATLIKDGAVESGQGVTDLTYVQLYAANAQGAATQAAAQAQTTTSPLTSAQILAYATAQNEQNGTFVLTDSAALASYAPAAAAALGLSVGTISTAQIQAYVNALYQSYASTLTEAYGAGWQAAASASGRGSFTVATGSSLYNTLTAGTAFNQGQVLSAISEQALEPVRGSVGTGTPNIVGRTVTVDIAQGGIGALAPTTHIDIGLVQTGTTTAAQQAALAAATAPGTVTLDVDLANGTAASGYNFTDLPAGATITGIDVAGEAPLFVSATSTFSATANSAVYVQATNALQAAAGTLTVGSISTRGDVSLLAPESIVGTSSTMPAITTTGDISLTAGAGDVGSLTLPFAYTTSGSLSYVSAGDSAFVESDNATTSVGRIFAVNNVTLDVPEGDLSSSLIGVAVESNNVNLVVQGSIGNVANPFDVQIGSGGLNTTPGLLNASAGDSIDIYGPTISGSLPPALPLGTLTAPGDIIVGADGNVSVADLVQSTSGSVSLRAAGDAADPTATFSMDTGALVEAENGINIQSAGSSILGTLLLTGSPATPQTISVTAANGFIEGNGDGPANLGASQSGDTVILTALDDIGTSTLPITVDAPLLQATSTQGSIYLTLLGSTDASAISAPGGAVTISGAASLLLGTVTSGGTQTISAPGDIDFTTLTTTAGDIDVTSTNGAISGATVDAYGSSTLAAYGNNTGSSLTTQTGGANLSSQTGIVDWALVNAGGTFTASAATGTIMLGTVTSGGTQTISARGDIDFTTLTTTAGDIDVTSGNGAISGVTVDAYGSSTLAAYGNNTGTSLTTQTGSANLSSQTGIVDWSFITAGTSVSISGNGIIFNTITAPVGIDLASTASIIGDQLNTNGFLELSAAGTVSLGGFSGSDVTIEAPGSITINSLTISKSLTLAATSVTIGDLIYDGEGALDLGLTGYHGSVGNKADLSVDSPEGIVITELRENTVVIDTNARQVEIEDAFLTGTMRLTTPLESLWFNDLSPQPVRGNDVQFYQPDDRFYFDQDNYSSTTDSLIVQYGLSAAVAQDVDGVIYYGASLVRDIDRQGRNGDEGLIPTVLDDDGQSVWSFPVEEFDLHLRQLSRSLSAAASAGSAVNLGSAAGGNSIIEQKGFKLMFRRAEP